MSLAKPDKTLLVVRKEAKTQLLLTQLIGTWHGTVPAELGKYSPLVFWSGLLLCVVLCCVLLCCVVFGCAVFCVVLCCMLCYLILLPP